MRLTKTATLKLIFPLFLSFIFYLYISLRIFQAKQGPWRNLVFVNNNKYLCKDSHHSCSAKALYNASLSKMPCLFCPLSCGLCVICPNNTHLWNLSCTKRDILINSLDYSYDTPTAKKYLADVYLWMDGSVRYGYAFAGIAISSHHVITGRKGGYYGDPKNYSIYLNKDPIKSQIKLTPIKFIQNWQNQTRKHELCIVVVKEAIPNEYIIPLTTVLNPEGRLGHFMGIGIAYVDSKHSLMEAEREIIVKNGTVFQNRPYLIMRTGEIDEGSPLLISEGGRYVLQGLYIFGAGVNKKFYSHFVNIGEELEWINQVINNTPVISAS